MDLRLMEMHQIGFMSTEVYIYDFLRTKTLEEIKKEFEDTYPERKYFIIDKNKLNDEDLKHYSWLD